MVLIEGGYWQSVCKEKKGLKMRNKLSVFFICFVLSFIVGCNQKSKSIEGKWLGNESILEFLDNGQFIATLYGPCPGVINVKEGFERVIKFDTFDVVIGESSCTADHFVWENGGTKGETKGKIEMKGLYKLKKNGIFQAYFRVKLGNKDTELDFIVFEVFFDKGNLKLNPKGITVTSGIYSKHSATDSIMDIKE